MPGSATARPLVSVVTPVHNTAAYLADCIRSVLAQSYPAWEYLIVDNASTDGSLEIARSFAALDPRIRVVTTERLLPQIVNFNFALRQIAPESRYCKMVLADDWIYPNCLEEMVALAETDPELALVGAYVLKSDAVKGAGLACDGPDRTTSVVAGRDACRRYLLDDFYVFGSPNAVLYRADLIRSRDPFFPIAATGYFQDALLCFEILERKKFGFVHQVLSYTRQGNVSVGTSVQSFLPAVLAKYVIAKKYGRYYLDESECRQCWARVERGYYLTLASSLFKRLGPEFWRYHTHGVELAGEQLDWRRIARLQLPRLLNLLGNPKRAMEGLWDHVRSRHGTPTESAREWAGSGRDRGTQGRPAAIPTHSANGSP